MAYGIGTRSFNRSTENRQMKKERAEFTAKYEAGEASIPKVDPRDFMVCACRSFRYPHTLEAHGKLRSEHDWREFEARERTESAGAGFQEWRVIP
jgi:hypothetical protein